MISAVVPSGGPATAPVTAGSDVDVLGTGLANPGAVVLVGGIGVTPRFVSATRLTATLPASLAAGAQSLQLRQDVALPPPDGAVPGALSAPAAFILSPTVYASPSGYAIALSNQSGTGSAPRSATVSVGVVPVVQAGQVTALELLDLALNPVGVYAEQPRSAAAGTLLFTVPAIAAGRYVLRVRVDGAPTQVVTDTAAGSPTLGQPVPQVAFA